MLFAVSNAKSSALDSEYFIDEIASKIKKIVRPGRIILIKIGLLSFLKNKDNILRPTLKNEIMEAINPASQNMPAPISIGIVDSGKINNGGIICSIHQIIDFFSRLIFILHTNPH